MEYLLKASGIVVILFLFYFLFLKNETFFKSIRAYFLLGLIIVVSIPLIEIPIYVEAVTNKISGITYQEITNPSSIEGNTFSWVEFLMNVYIIGVAFFILKFLTQLGSLTYFIATHKLTRKGKYKYIETTKSISPFSFFNIIIYNKKHFSIDELEQIILHEKAHVSQWHSLDTLLTHILVIILWFNPFVWLYKKAIQQNLEFLADAYALKQLNDQKFYQYTLLKTGGTNFCTAITNNFYNTLIKKRILMIHKNQSKKHHQLKYLLLVPVFIAFIMTFNTKVIAQEKNEWTVNVRSEIVDLIINKNSSDANLEKETITFKNEFNINLSFKGIKRNASNEITAIKIEAKGENLKAKFENSGSDPIKPIKITYDSENNSVSIGNINEIHQQHFSFTSDGDNKVHFKGKPTKEGNYVFINENGEKTSWTTKTTDTIIHKNKIIIKQNDDEHVWVSKDDKDIKVEVIEVKDGKKVIKIIENGDTKVIEEEIEIIHEGDHKSENVFFIIKSDDFKITKEKKEQKEIKGEKATKESKEQKVFFKSASNQEPLFILDGKAISKEAMEKIDPENMESVNVLKGDSAVKKYGEKGANGVIEIKIKKN